MHHEIIIVKLLHVKMKFTLLRSIIQVVLLVFSVNIPHAHCFKDANFLNQLFNLTTQGVTEDQIRKWWYLTQAKDRDYPRVFPFCFDPNLVLPPQTKAFKMAMEDYATVTDYDPEIRGWPGRDNTIFESVLMDFKRISIQRSTVNNNVFGGAEGKTPFKLQQYVDFLVTFRTKVTHFYVQAIGGPLGTPTGEFTKEFKCTQGEVDPAKYQSITYIEPCHFSPRSAYKWPNVFILKDNTVGLNKIQFRYRWTETHCQETVFFQFIMVADKNNGQPSPPMIVNNYDIILSPIFRYVNLDSPSAVPSPYHPYYNSIKCGLGSSDSYSQNIQLIGDGLRIIPNKDYDDCVLRGTGRGNGVDLDMCPPGFFECSQYWNGDHEWKTKTEEWWKEIVIQPVEDCCEVEFPLTGGHTTTTASPVETTESPLRDRQKKQEKYLNLRTRRYESRHRITHGDFCVLVWLVFIPLADSICRYFKDFAEIEGLGLGFWIIMHIVLHSTGLMCVWYSFGLVVGGGEDKLGNVSGAHFISGFIATFIQHIQFITGFKRTRSERFAFNYVLIHSLLGYASKVVAYICVIVSTAGRVRQLITLGLFLIWLIFTFALYLLERYQDRQLEVFNRSQCPVLQRIVIERGAPPMGKRKIGILVLLVIGQASLYVYMLVVHSAEKTVSKAFAKDA